MTLNLGFRLNSCCLAKQNENDKKRTEIKNAWKNTNYSWQSLSLLTCRKRFSLKCNVYYQIAGQRRIKNLIKYRRWSAFCIKGNKSNLLNIFAKSSNLTISQGCEYASAFQHKKRQIRKTSGKIFTSKCMKILKTLKKKFLLEKGKCLFSVKMHDLDLK